jgi:tetratricopeptide (TPR) repeat protein
LFAAAILMVVCSSWGVAPESLAGFHPDQSAPVAGSQPIPADEPKPLTLEERADIFMARKNYADAADYYYQALKQSSFKNPVVWNKLGIAFQQASNFHSAHRAYQNAIRNDGRFADAWNNQGTVFYMEKKYARSVKCYQRAVGLKGDAASYHMNLGTSYYHLKKFDKAVEEYRAALNIDPDVTSHESLVGTVVSAGSADVEFYFYLAKAFASVGNAPQAVRYLRHALEDGLSNPKRIGEDPDFKKISQHPAFVELMQNPPVAIKE